MAIADGKKFTVLQIKNKVKANGSPFFSRNNMKFFGDTMKSFATVLDDDGVTVLYRKPSATICDMRGDYVRAGRDFFNCWAFLAGDLRPMVSEDEKTRIYEKV